MRRMLRESPTDSAGTCAALHQWLLAQPGVRTVATYSPLPGEIDLAAAIVLHPGIRWLYPRVAGHHLTFHSGEILIPGEFGILEPPPGTPEVPLCEIDVFLCPGLAFDPQGGRLGRGKGFYDRLLARARHDSFKVGICHRFQIVADTFPEPHDIEMDAVVS